jgi:membrane protein implicated in regulation of membrane protease activity
MPQLLLLLAVGIVAWMGYKKFLKEAERVSKTVRRTEKESETGATGTLVKDPDTGEYRIEKDEDEV